MVKYKPPGSPKYLNLKELLDTVFAEMNHLENRLNKIEEKLSE